MLLSDWRALALTLQGVYWFNLRAHSLLYALYMFSCIVAGSVGTSYGWPFLPLVTCKDDTYLFWNFVWVIPTVSSTEIPHRSLFLHQSSIKLTPICFETLYGWHPSVTRLPIDDLMTFHSTGDTWRWHLSALELCMSDTYLPLESHRWPFLPLEIYEIDTYLFWSSVWLTPIFQ